MAVKERVPSATLGACVTLLQLVTAACLLTLLLSGSLPWHGGWVVLDNGLPHMEWRRIQTQMSFARLPTPGNPLKVCVREIAYKKRQHKCCIQSCVCSL